MFSQILVEFWDKARVARTLELSCLSAGATVQLWMLKVELYRPYSSKNHPVDATVQHLSRAQLKAKAHICHI